MATSAAVVVAAASGRARREIEAHFEEAGALQAADAVPYTPPSRLHRQQFARLVNQGILREADDGHFWLDHETRVAAISERTRAAMIGLAVLAITGLVVAGLVAVFANS
jgi:hypothetical protein